MPRLIHLLSALMLAGPVWASSQSKVKTPSPPKPSTPAETAQLIKEILALGDEANAKIFQRLAGVKSEQALEGLHQIALASRNYGHVQWAYSAFSAFGKSDELLPKALGVLTHDSLEHELVTHRKGAVQALINFDKDSLAHVEQVLDQTEDEKVLRLVVTPMVGVLLSRANEESLDLVLAYGNFSGRKRPALIQAMRAAVLAPESAEFLVPKFAALLKDPDQKVETKSVLLSSLKGVQHPKVLAALAVLTKHERIELRLRAIELLGDSGVIKVEKVLKHLTRNRDDAVVREAIAAMAKLHRDDPKWIKIARRWTRDKQVGARMGACIALAYAKDRASSKALHAMLADKEWRVRLEAIAQVAGMRRKPSIPILIARLSQEDGRLVKDLNLALQRMTGLDYGLRPNRWQAWWAGEGESFVLPTAKESQAARVQRLTKPGKGRTVSTGFYGLEVASGSVAFVIDISGSMKAQAKGRRSHSGGQGKTTRLDVAKQELEVAVQNLAEGVSFNIITFGGRVRPWAEGQTKIGKRSRSQALKFTREIKITGGTNTYGGLMAAFDDEQVDTIYLLSDGKPSQGKLVSPDAIREHFRLLNRVRRVRIHCISVGQASELMRGLAEDSGGEYVEVL